MAYLEALKSWSIYGHKRGQPKSILKRLPRGVLANKKAEALRWGKKNYPKYVIDEVKESRKYKPRMKV